MCLHLRQLALVALVAGAPGLAVAADDGWQAQVGETLGKAGSATPSGIYRVGLPRTDLKVTLDGVELKAGFALGSWLAFEKMGDQGMVMGDLVLTMDEVAPVMTKLAAGGIEVTALHNHFLHDEPKVYFMHIGGQGDPEKLAAAVKGVWDAIKKVRADSPKPCSGFGCTNTVYYMRESIAVVGDKVVQTEQPQNCPSSCSNVGATLLVTFMRVS